MQTQEMLSNPLESISLLEIKQYLRLNDDDAEDELLKGIILGSQLWAEGFCKRMLFKTTIAFSSACNEFVVPLGISNVVEAKYYVGAQASNAAVTHVEPNSSYLSLRKEEGATKYLVIVDFGMSTVPEDIKLALKIKCGSLYDSRQEDARRYATTAENLLLPHKMYNI